MTSSEASNWISAIGSGAAAAAAWFSWSVSRNNHELQRALTANDRPELNIWWELAARDSYKARLTVANTGRRAFIAKSIEFLAPGGERLMAAVLDGSAKEPGPSLQDFKLDAGRTTAILLKSVPAGQAHSSINAFEVRIQFYSGEFSSLLKINQGWLGPYPVENEKPRP